MSESATPTFIKVIRDPRFAKRLADSVENHPIAPSGHGRQKWVREEFQKRYNVKLSPEAVRRWFAGEVRPRPATMQKLAMLLDVDEAWLSLGITPDEAPVDRRKRNARADGAVNYVAGLIQLGGGHIAFPDESKDEAQPDLFAIIHGRQYRIEVKQAHPQDGRFTLRLPAMVDDLTLIVVVETKSPMEFDLIRVPTEVMAAHGTHKGGFIELEVEQKGSTYRIAGEVVRKLTSIGKIDGDTSPSRVHS